MLYGLEGFQEYIIRGTTPNNRQEFPLRLLMAPTGLQIYLRILHQGRQCRKNDDYCIGCLCCLYSLTTQVRGFSRAEFKGFRTVHEAEAYLNGGCDPDALHNLHASSRPQTKRRPAAPGPAWLGRIKQESGPVQPHHQFHMASGSASRTQVAALHDVDDTPKCQDCNIVNPADLYRLVISR